MSSQLIGSNRHSYSILTQLGPPSYIYGPLLSTSRIVILAGIQLTISVIIHDLPGRSIGNFHYTHWEIRPRCVQLNGSEYPGSRSSDSGILIATFGAKEVAEEVGLNTRYFMMLPTARRKTAGHLGETERDPFVRTVTRTQRAGTRGLIKSISVVHYI